MISNDFILTKPAHFSRLHGAAPQAKLCTSLEEISSGGDSLVVFGSSLIVPGQLLQCYRQAYNFHGASPDYPGRDPHHWACYENAKTFGAVAHVMHAEVDQGPIVGGILFGVPDNAPPQRYRARAQIALYALFETMATDLFTEGLPPNGMRWSGTVRRRADLLSLCDMRGCSKEEKNRRNFACQGFESMFSE